MQKNALGLLRLGSIFNIREDACRRNLPMSVHPFPRQRMVAPPPLEPYYQADPVPRKTVALRPMTALEQMYAYWGQDRD